MVQLSIDHTTCIRCGNCVVSCPVRILQQPQPNGEIQIENLQICIKCSQCVTICPTDSITHSSFPPSIIHRVQKEILPSPQSLLELMKKRRSSRMFSQKPIPMEYLDLILEAANLAPTAKNGRPLKYTLITNPEILETIHKTCIEVCNNIHEKLSASDEAQHKAIGRYLNYVSNTYKHGYEIILRGATAVLLIHTEDMKDTADANLAYQNASLMAEALDVAHFYTGYVRLISAYDSEATIQKVVGIKGHILSGMALAMPKATFKKYADKNDLQVTKIL